MSAICGRRLCAGFSCYLDREHAAICMYFRALIGRVSAQWSSRWLIGKHDLLLMYVVGKLFWYFGSVEG